MTRGVQRTLFGVGMTLAFPGAVILLAAVLAKDQGQAAWGSGVAALGFLCIAIAVRAPSSGQGGR